MKKLSIYLVLMISALSIVIVACQKGFSGSEKNKARLQVYLTDAPGDFEAVYIDVKDVKINVTGDSVNGWQSLAGVNAGVYDLLTLINDNDTLLADAEIPSGKIHQLRLVLGTENFVKVEGTTQLIKLETPSAQQSGLKLNIQQDVENGILYTLLLDFDVSKSIHKTGNNKYMLKPVIRTVLQAAGGSIKGVVMPNSFQTAVYAVQGPDTIASTFTGTNGGYLIKGLAAGSYNLHYDPSDLSYMDSIRNNIVVITNKVTIVDTTVLHQ
ncbi:MAG TPA: DUF4382 domain-containing protein [Chitinophagaceae bacterium]|nr:DUF4382 domain-containing protein [Chitinophagaceae bacterium]